MKKRKSPSSEFQAKVALEAIREDMTLVEQSKKYGVYPTQIGTWKRTAIENMTMAFSRRGAAPEKVSAAEACSSGSMKGKRMSYAGVAGDISCSTLDPVL